MLTITIVYLTPLLNSATFFQIYRINASLHHLPCSITVNVFRSIIYIAITVPDPIVFEVLLIVDV